MAQLLSRPLSSLRACATPLGRACACAGIDVPSWACYIWSVGSSKRLVRLGFCSAVATYPVAPEWSQDRAVTVARSLLMLRP
eukprot:6576090-Alexandrium_andersonii.AAC.1